MMKNILVPYDFTGFADSAFEKAREIGEKFGSKIILLTIINNGIDTSGMSLSRAEEKLDKIKETVSHMDISVKIIHSPSTIDRILSFVGKNDIYLIVMGSHGRSGFKKLVLGSVAAAIITKAQCPGLTVKSSKSHNVA